MYLTLQMQVEEAKVLKEHEEELLKDLREAVRAEKEGKKITRQTKPAIVLENREPPEIPEFKMEEAIPSPYTKEDAVWFMFRLTLFSRIRQARIEMEEEKKAILERERKERELEVENNALSEREKRKKEREGDERDPSSDAAVKDERGESKSEEREDAGDETESKRENKQSSSSKDGPQSSMLIST